MNMATIERDYGVIYGNSATNSESEVITHRLVYLATHRGDGINRLPFMNRSFISFTYGGKAIEDFDLIATFVNGRLDKDGYSSFNDLITTYDNLDGLLYWGTHYTTNSLTFNLSTDGIDLKKLDEFLHWFSAGVSRELILAEHPNRAQMARIAEPPKLSLLPFKHDTIMIVSSQEYPIITTLYKGDITLTFIMDDPHWYAKTNLLGKEVTKNQRTTYLDYWTDTTVTPNKDVWIYDSPDAMKILYEDGIPLGSMIEHNMLLGNRAYANVEDNASSKTWSIEDRYITWTYDGLGKKTPEGGSGARINGSVVASGGDGINSINLANSPYPIGNYSGIINGAIIEANDAGIASLDSGSTGHFYYAGTAPATTIISFTLTPKFNDNYYISTPLSKVGNIILLDNRSNKPYNTITFTSNTVLELKFTTPNILTSYNLAMYILSTEINNNATWEKIYNSIRDKVRHPAVRAWMTKVFDYYKRKALNITDNGVRDLLKNGLKYLVCKLNSETPEDIQFSFNSKTGEALGTFKYRTVTNNLPSDEALNPFLNYGEVKAAGIVEDVGDMLYSNYIVIKDRNYPNEYGKIVAWSNDSVAGHSYSHKITHDVYTELKDFLIEYKNMYL